MALDPTIEKDIREVLRNGANLQEFDERQLLDAWLTWQGIIGYTGRILQVVDQIRAFKDEVLPDPAAQRSFSNPPRKVWWDR